ncbi:MAG: response regulator transcription factor [Sphingomonas sp.]|jgi:two-component system torCAD operon response regulator TorR|nr:MAG: response regulator transcription factor [Sphingomonas sp.]
MPNNKQSPMIDEAATADQFSNQKFKLIIAGSPGDSIGIIKHISIDLYDVRQAKTSCDLHNMLSEDVWDLVIIDVKVPDIDSVSLIKVLSSSNKSFRLLVRSESDDEVDRVLALELGADDCVALSCSPREIQARVRALLRRCTNDIQKEPGLSVEQNRDLGAELFYEGWVLNRDRCVLYSPSGDVIALTNAEYGILVNLFREPGLVKDRSSLLNVNSESSEYDIRSLDVFVSRLRKKMNQYNGHDLIETVRGRGYRLNVNISRVG